MQTPVAPDVANDVRNSSVFPKIIIFLGSKGGDGVKVRWHLWKTPTTCCLQLWQDPQNPKAKSVWVVPWIKAPISKELWE